ncbi:MAG: hypothetical protein ACRDVK_07535 [Acidimicrobiia bacterium]
MTVAEIGNRLKRLGLLGLLPLLVASGAAAYTYRDTPAPSTRYRSTVVILPPTMIQESAGAVNLFLADLSERILTDSVVTRVLEEVPALDRNSYLEGVTADRRGITSVAELAMVHADAGVAEKAVDALARIVLDDSARTEFDRTQFLLGRASDRLDQAKADLGEFMSSGSIFDPEIEYRNALSEIAQLDQQLTTARALSYGETYLSELEGRRAVLEATLPRLGEAMLSFRRLSAELESAREAWERAATDSDQAEFEYETVNTYDKLVVSRATEAFIDDAPRTQRTALAGVIALTLSLAIALPISQHLGRNSRKAIENLITVDLKALANEEPTTGFDSARDIIIRALANVGSGKPAGRGNRGEES